MSPMPPRAAHRLATGIGAGLLTTLLVPHNWPAEARILLGWAGFCLVNLIRLARFLDYSPEQTRQLATREDETRVVAASLTILSALVSLVGVLFTLHAASQAKGTLAYLLTGLAVLTVTLSWLLIQAEYTLHYARRYYTDNAGVQFTQHGRAEPLRELNIVDFAYLSFTIGMTFQASDMLLDTHRMRRLLLGHALLSYGFSAVIIAVTFSAVASIAG
ncbi:DUF1345 domain-containing protein [Deinococcus sp.]|uniref:DUF1345 domain-containing protein n=1 Tax=Deinococcus sp. TaxID=47478 RepID=UPI0025C002EF|nr:DUF1345 domain-containing protein [Deinococcus sp.]